VSREKGKIIRKKEETENDTLFAPSHISARAKVVDLNAWHHAIHQVTGDMALRFNRATPADLKRWASMLRKVAEEMEASSANGEGQTDGRHV
jgi:endogenous inhibitor of DNA gyrase (YacG/DUF329 family)